MTGNRWLARLSILLLAAAAGILIGFAGPRSVVLIVTGVVGTCAMLAGAYWFLSNRGVLRWAAGALAVLVPAAVIVLYAWRNLLLVAVLAVAAMLLGEAIASRALRPAAGQPSMPERPAARPRRAFLIMNPRSGDGKVARFGLREKAESLGAQIAMLDGPEIVDVAALARKAVAAGADLLGVAGGDGTQALVAGVAAEHRLPFLCISAGTRNHFAMDLGLDREDPSTCLNALTDGVELRIDLGLIGDRTFVNNASFGAYAEVVRSPEYRADKTGTTLQMLPDLLKRDGTGLRLSAQPSGVAVEDSQALLVSNNPYATADTAGLGRRVRLDQGTLGVIAVSVNSAAQAIGLMRLARGSGLTLLSAPEVTITADHPEIPVGIDGETVTLPTPVRCVIQPGALRVVVPRTRPGARPARPAFSWPRLLRLAAFHTRTPDAETAR